MTGLKALARDCLPPLLVRMLKHLKKQNIVFEGEYLSWSEAAAASQGYDQSGIVDKVLDSTLKVKSGEAEYERDSVLFDTIQYSWPVTAGLMCAASRSTGRLNVLDYGGALGTHYFQNKKIMNLYTEYSWNIVEQPHYVELGKLHIEDTFLHFYSSVSDYVRESRPNVVLASSVLQYVPEPLETLGELASIGADTIILDRTPYLNSETEAKLKVQKVPGSIYPASYPCWFLVEDQIISLLESRGYFLVESFEALDKLHDSATWKGHLFTRG